MTAIRIYLGAMDRMLGGIVADLLARENDIEVVGRSLDGEHSLQGARADRAEVLVLQEGRGDSAPLTSLLDPPPLSILAIAQDGRNSRLVRLDTKNIPLNGHSGGALASAIRLAAGRG